MKETKTFEEFNRRFFETLSIIDVHYSDNSKSSQVAGIHYFNKKVVVNNIRPDVNAEIVLEIDGMGGQYEGYTVSILHKTNGKIVSGWFGFNDYLEIEKKDLRNGNRGLCIIEHVGKDWYIEKPTEASVKKMVKAITEYISLYK
jgi:hypothetical protein